MIDSENSSILVDAIKRISKDICNKGIESIIKDEVEHLRETKPILFVFKNESNIEKKMKKYISILENLKRTDEFKSACTSNKKDEELRNMIMDAIVPKGGKRSRRKRKTLKRKIRHRRTSRK